MRKIYFLIAALFLFGAAKAQVIFSEDFDGIAGPTSGGPGTYTFPNGWFLRNVDNKTPNTAVAYVNDAWERREDFSFNVADSCAFSTSWYAPVGAADDWMWTPLIGPIPANCVLKWNALAYDPLYPDGYSVRIMTSSQGPPTGGTGVMGNQVTNSTQVFSIPSENSAWTARQISLSAYAGQSIYIAFRNTSNDQFILLIDDISVEVQLTIDAQMAVADTATPYTIMPANQTTPLTLNGTIRNNGINALSNVSAHVNVLNGSTNVYSANSTTTTSLAPNATVNWTIPSFTPAGAGLYTIQYIANQTSGTDLNHNNDTLYQYLLVDDSTYARDDGLVIGSLGIGAGNGYIGQSFQITNASAPMTSVGVYYTQGYTGRRAGLAIWNTNSSGVPTTIAAVTDTIIYPDDSARYYVIPVHGGPLTLSPGNYAVTAIEFDSTVAVGISMNVYTQNAGWVYWNTIPGGNWMNPEDFGPGFARAYVIRPNFADVCLNNSSTISSTQATCLTCTDGSATVVPVGTDGTVTYSWSPSGGNAATATGLGTGTYIVTVTDGFGCMVHDTVVVAFDTCGGFAATSSSVATSCGICADGSATITPTGGYGTLTYVWANSSETSSTISNVLPGTYTVTVTDSFGCAITQQIIINQNICGNVSITIDSTQASCSTCADGSVWVDVTGNNGPVTYQWSNGGTTDSISGLLPGVYTVIVTDSAGCTFNVGLTLYSYICGDIAGSISSMQSTCSSCADGSAVYTVTGDNGGLTYLWSDNQTNATASNLLPGTYFVTATDSAGCSVSDTIVVNYDLCSNVTFTDDSLEASCGTCADGAASVFVSGNNGPVTYLWSNGGTTSTISGLMPGVYSVIITDSLGCTFYDTITVTYIDGIAENNFPGTANLFPNPNNGSFTLDVNMNASADLYIEIVNLLGEKLTAERRIVYGNTIMKFDLGLPAGTYLVRLSTSEGSRIIPLIIQ